MEEFPVQPPSRINVVLHQPEIPQNAGNIARTCVAVNAKLWLIRPLAFRLDDRRLKRSALDYWPFLDWQAVSDWETLREYTDPCQAWYFSKSAQRQYTEVSFKQGEFLVFGSETRGLPQEVLQKHADRSLRIPTSDHVRSLNLSNAVAVVLYEALRQWQASE